MTGPIESDLSSSQDSRYQPYPPNRSFPPGFLPHHPRQLISAPEVAPSTSEVSPVPASGRRYEYPSLNFPATPVYIERSFYSIPDFLPVNNMLSEEQFVFAQITDLTDEDFADCVDKSEQLGGSRPLSPQAEEVIMPS